MNKAILIIFVLLSLHCSNKKTFYDSSLNYYELEYWGLTGSVNSFEEKGFYRKEKAVVNDLIDLDLVEDFRISHIQDHEFNKKGLLTERNFYNSTETLSWQLSNVYDTKNRLLKTVVLKGDKTIRYYNEFIYDKEGNQIQEITYREDSTVRLRKIFEYNELNQKTLEKWTEMKSGPQVHEIYEYNSDGHLKIMNYSDGQNELKFVYAYTKDGKPASIIVYNPDETIKKKEVFKYQDGSLIEKINTDHSKNSKTILHFNSKGLLSKIERFKLGNDKAVEFEEYKYAYDKHENWIRKTTFKNDELFHIYFREIQYF